MAQVRKRNSCPVTDSSMKPTVRRFGAPPSGVAAPPALVPQATAITSAVPTLLFQRSSMPTERNIATTIGIIVAATIVFGRTPERTALTQKPDEDLPARVGPHSE